jgi:hypothetical protein
MNPFFFFIFLYISLFSLLCIFSSLHLLTKFYFSLLFSLFFIFCFKYFFPFFLPCFLLFFPLFLLYFFFHVISSILMTFKFSSSFIILLLFLYCLLLYRSYRHRSIYFFTLHICSSSLNICSLLIKCLFPSMIFVSLRKYLFQLTS